MHDSTSHSKVILRNHVIALARTLDPDMNYSLEAICGPDFWSLLDDGQRRQMGRYMADMVVEEDVPYRFAGKLCQSPKLYRVA